MKKQFSYVAFVALASVLLASCGTSSTDTTSLTGYSGDGFSMDVPKSWIEKKASELPTASKGTIALAMTSTDISS
jgi:hypothetical protein